MNRLLGFAVRGREKQVVLHEPASHGLQLPSSCKALGRS